MSQLFYCIFRFKVYAFTLFFIRQKKENRTFKTSNTHTHKYINIFIAAVTLARFLFVLYNLNERKKNGHTHTHMKTVIE
jgi:hypothetical protein